MPKKNVPLWQESASNFHCFQVEYLALEQPLVVVQFLVLLVDLHVSPDLTQIFLTETNLSGDGKVGCGGTEGQVPERV